MEEQDIEVLLYHSLCPLYSAVTVSELAMPKRISDNERVQMQGAFVSVTSYQ